MWPILAQGAGEPGGLQQTIDRLARTPLSEIVVFVAICSLIRIAIYSYLKKTPAHKRLGLYSAARFLNEGLDAIVYAGVFVFMIIRPFVVQAFLIPSGSMEQTLYVNDFIVANKAIYRYSEPQLGDIIVFKPPQRALNADQHDMDFIKRLIGRPGDVVEIRNGKLWRNGVAIDEPYLSSSPGEGAQANGHPTETGLEVRIATDWKLVHYLGKARPDLYDRYIPVQIGRPNPNFPVDPQIRYNYGPGIAIANEFAMGSDAGPHPMFSYVQMGDWKPISNLTPKELQYEAELRESPPAAIPKGFYLMMGDNRNFSYDSRGWGLVAREDIIGRSEFIWFPINRWRITR